MIANAVELVGRQVTDSSGRIWIVAEVGTKAGWPTISGDDTHPFWDRPEAVTQIRPPAQTARGGKRQQTPPFHFDAARAGHEIVDAEGAIWPVNSFSNADELNSLTEAAVDAGVISPGEVGGYIQIYPRSISESDPVLAISRVGRPTLLGSSLKLRDRDGETPLEFTLRPPRGNRHRGQRTCCRPGGDSMTDLRLIGPPT